MPPQDELGVSQPAAQQPKGPPPVTLFESGHEGYGDAQRENIKQSYDLFRGHSRLYSYNRVLGNMRLSTPGEAAAGELVETITLPFALPPVFAAEWVTPSGDPVIYVVGATAVSGAGTCAILAVSGGAAILIATIASGVASAGAMHDDGSGVPYLYAATAGLNDGIDLGSNAKVVRMSQAEGMATAANLVADKLLSLNNDLYITLAPGGGSSTRCGVGKVPAGTDPFTAAQPSLTVVGFAGAGINNIVAAGDGRAPIVLKPDGIYAFSLALDVWTPLGRIPYHADNGKAFWYEDSDLCVALGEGGAVRVNGTTLRPYDPLPLLISMPDVSTPTQVIAAAGQMRQWGVLVTKPGAKAQRTGGVGAGAKQVTFLKTINGGTTYTDQSANVNDANAASSASLANLPASTGGLVAVGHPQPFVGVYFDIPHNPNSNAASMTALLGSPLGASITIYDGTQSAGASMARTGWVICASDPIAGGWVPTTLNGVTLYWMLFTWNAALDAAMDVAGISVLPWRPSIDPAIFPLDGLDRAGAYPHVLFSRADDTGKHIVHDFGPVLTGVLPEPGPVLYANGGGGVINQDRALWIFGTAAAARIALQPDDRPEMYAWPLLGGHGGFEMPSVDLGEVSEIDSLTIDGIDWNATGYCYYRFEDGKAWSRSPAFDTLPVTFRNLGGRAGQMLKVAIAYTLTAAQQRPAQRPRIKSVVVQPRPSSQHPSRLPQQTPPVV